MPANLWHDVVEERDEDEVLEQKVNGSLKPHCVIHKTIDCFSVLIF